MKRERNLFHRAASLMLAVVMVFSVIIIMPKDVRAANFTLPAGGGSITITDPQSYVFTREEAVITYTAAKDGSLQISFLNATQIKENPISGYAWGEATFCNAAGTPIANKFTFDTRDTREGFYSDVYGVKKGTTYKLRVVSAGGVTVSAKFTAIKKKLNKNFKKGKAVTLKRKKQTDGMIESGSTTAHWYKFKMTKPQKLNVGITPKLTSSFKVTIKGPGVKTGGGQISCRYWSGNDYYLGFWGKRYTFSTKGKVRPGTYYIQIQPISRTCGGSYKVNWK